MYYYLEDDTVAVKELKENQEGRDHFPMFMKRTKLPHDWKRQPGFQFAIMIRLSLTLHFTLNSVIFSRMPRDNRQRGH